MLPRISLISIAQLFIHSSLNHKTMQQYVGSLHLHTATTNHVRHCISDLTNSPVKTSLENNNLEQNCRYTASHALLNTTSHSHEYHSHSLVQHPKLAKIITTDQPYSPAMSTHLINHVSSLVKPALVNHNLKHILKNA